MSSSARPWLAPYALSAADPGRRMDWREVAPYANLGDVARIVAYGHFLDVVRQLSPRKGV